MSFKSTVLVDFSLDTLEALSINSQENSYENHFSYQ